MSDTRNKNVVTANLEKNELSSPAIQVREVKVPLADAAILAVVSKVSLQGDVSWEEQDEAVLAALRRAHPSAGNTNDELGRWLSQMDENQLSGVISNTKGVLHEMRFVEMENTDGDTVYAAQFAATNHAGYDVVFSDEATGTEWAAQLKTTNSEAYVQEWLEQHPDGDILVTSEIAERMGLQSSGFANAELTADTEHLVDQLVLADQGDVIWDYIPGLTALSTAAVVYELHQRLLRGEISRDRFAWMAAKSTGISAARVVVLTALLSIPVINIATGLALIVGFLSSSGLLGRINAYIDQKMAVMNAVSDLDGAAYTEKVVIEGALKSADLSVEVQEKLKDKSEEYRETYWKAFREFSAQLKEGDFSSDSDVLAYKDPAAFTPPEHPHGEIENLIRAKVNEIEERRLQSLRQAKIALNDARRRPEFINSLERSVGKDDSEILLSIIVKA